jgi:hypothetical protein
VDDLLPEDDLLIPMNDLLLAEDEKPEANLFLPVDDLLPVDVPGAEVWEVAQLGGKHSLGAVTIGQLDRLLNLLCK